MVEVSLTVGKLDASLALLLTKDHHLIEFPTILLPNGVRAGSIVKIKCDQDLECEKEEQKQFQQIQDDILHTFGTNLPSVPNLKIKNVTQTSCVLEWDTLELGTANLKNLILFKDGKKLGGIPQPLTSKTTKLSGLSIDETFQFQLRLDTTAGVYLSEVIEVTTHKMTDLSGITVCMGDIAANEQFTIEDIENTLKNMGANHPPQDKIRVDTTHFVCTRENKQNPEYLKACDMNIPIVRPEWLKACERERRIVGVRDFYVKDCILPDILAKNYWQNGNVENNTARNVDLKEPVSENDKEVENQPDTTSTAIVTEDDTESEKVNNQSEGDKEKTNEGIDTSDTKPSINVPEVLATPAPESNDDQLEEVKLGESTNSAEADDKDDSELKQEEQTEIEPQLVHADSIELATESDTKTEEPEVAETKIEASETSETKQEDARKGEVEDANNTPKESEPSMDEIKLDDNQIQITNGESNTETKEMETASEKLEPMEKEETAKSENTVTEGEDDTAEKEDPNNASTSASKKKKKNNKKKNKKK